MHFVLFLVDDHAFLTGTGKFLAENADFLQKNATAATTSCNKDTGGRKTLQSWSRGTFFVVTGGGHIEYWQPLYRLSYSI